MEDPEEYEGFVFVSYNKQDILKECWINLPVQMTFVDFCEKVDIAPTKTGYLYSIKCLLTNCIWIIHMAWSISPYIPTIWTAVKYRKYLYMLI
jgi:hypothetical protein